ncbi:MAG: glucose 1-dehydrogenase [Spongiibacteraceae bacterium]|jgi:NAD(P)-dependent dehydrogenase (short-subunit alcohol dehydrogenase family)|nr:glucose 1-dehydrogenase [Spongiibacteraceae bacterium]
MNQPVDRPNAQRFVDKVILVTGAGSGIGRAAALAFAREGGRVVAADRNGQSAEAAVAAIRDGGGEASAVTVDVSRFEDCRAMVQHTLETYGALHIAFNNAGIPSPIGGQFEDVDIADWQRLIDTNLNGVFYAMKAEVPAMRACGGTAIVNTASVASHIAQPGMPAYVASKHAVAGLTRAAALDLIPHGIRVNAICPGLTRTGMLAEALATPEAEAQLGAQAPIGRVGEAEEAAAVALFLASDEASYMVGSLLVVDGGVMLL